MLLFIINIVCVCARSRMCAYVCVVCVYAHACVHVCMRVLCVCTRICICVYDIHNIWLCIYIMLNGVYVSHTERHYRCRGITAGIRISFSYLLPQQQTTLE